jgi:hypothetical protein
LLEEHQNSPFGLLGYLDKYLLAKKSERIKNLLVCGKKEFPPSIGKRRF